MANVLGTVTAAAVSSIAAPAAALFHGKDGERSVRTSFAVGAVGTIAWGLFTFTEIFAPSLSGNIIGDSTFGTINNLETIPFYATVLFELGFALLAANLVAASVQHRVKPFWLVAITTAITVGAYAPFAHWMWAPTGSNWLGLGGPGSYGAVDWAGGICVNVIAGVAALVLGVMTGVKQAEVKTDATLRNLSVVGLLVASYFLNAGKGNSALALLNTQMAAFSGVASYAALQVVVPWAADKKYFEGSATLEGAVKGAVIGLVATSAGAGIVLPMWTVLIAFIASLLIYVAEKVTAKWQTAGLEVFVIHGFGGAISATLTGLFAQGPLAFPGSMYPNGSFFYNAPLLGKQCAAVSVAVLLSGVVTYVVTKFLMTVAQVTVQQSILIEEEVKAEAKTESA